jgi:hypothetical protein
VSFYDVFKTAAAILASIGIGGATVAALAGWLGKVWANRLMEQDRAKYSTELEALKSKFEQSHRKLQAELDKTIFGHQLRTQTEFNALLELWKKVPPLESELPMMEAWARIHELTEAKHTSLSQSFLKGSLEKCERLTHELESLVGTYGPFIDLGVHGHLKELLNIARDRQIEIGGKMMGLPSPPVAGSPRSPRTSTEFSETSKSLFRAVHDRIEELSQHTSAPRAEDLAHP